MKLLKILNRPIAFHRCLAELTGSVTAGLMLSQAVYWTDRTKDPDGWFWKTQDDWFDETMLSRKEQETARRRLKELGNGSVWQEQLRGVPAKLFYRVDIEALEALLMAVQDAPNGHSSMPESDKLDCPKVTNKSAPNGQALIGTETTSETTTGGDVSSVSATPAAPPPIKASTTVNDLGDILEDAYPGHATNWRTMRDLRELVNRVSATRSDVLAFPGWLERNHPRKANTPFAFKDLFAEMVRSQQAATAKQSTPSYCGECQSGWMLTDTGATPCNCSRSNNESHNHRATVNA